MPIPFMPIAYTSAMERSTTEHAGDAPTRVPKIFLPPADATLQELIDALYAQIRGRVVLKDVRASNVMTIIMYTLKAAEKQQQLTDAEKKEVVVSLVNRLVGEIEGEAGDVMALQSAVVLLLPNLIETLVAETRKMFDRNNDGVVTFEEVRQTTSNCWRTCFPCGGARTAAAPRAASTVSTQPQRSSTAV
jgi:hypothetical protein